MRKNGEMATKMNMMFFLIIVNTWKAAVKSLGPCLIPIDYCRWFNKLISRIKVRMHKSIQGLMMPYRWHVFASLRLQFFTHNTFKTVKLQEENPHQSVPQKLLHQQ